MPRVISLFTKLMHRLLKNNTQRFGLVAVFLLLLFCLPVLLPLFKPGFFLTDDGEWMIIRFSAFYDALRDGQLPVRWLGRLYHGYGYPVANFLYPGFMYLGAPIHFLGFGFVNTIKIIMGVSMAASAVFSYFWLSRFFNRLASLLGALFYLYLPYHLFDLYGRGSVGELLALAVVPFILWQIERKSILFASLGLSFLILSHNTLALLFFPVILFYMLLDVLVAKERLQLLYFSIAIVLLGIGMSAFFWIPALYELQYTIFSNTQVSEWDQYFATFSLIGLPVFLVIFLTGVMFAAKLAVPAKHRLTILFLVIGAVSLYFSLPLSTLFWQVLPVSVVQFPFRFLSITLLSVSFLTAFVFSITPGKYKAVMGGVLMLSLFLSSANYFSPKEYFDKGDMYYATNQSTTTTHDEYLSRQVTEKAFSQAEEKVTVSGGSVNAVDHSSFFTKFDLSASKTARVTINTMYFPGWRVFVDSRELNISYDNPKGVIEFSLPAGEHSVEAVFRQTPVRMLANMLSLISFLSLIALVFYTRVGRLFLSRKK